MDSFLSRFGNALFLVALLLVQTVGLAVQVHRPAGPGAPDGLEVTLARSWVVGAVTPVERLTHNSGAFLRSAWSGYIGLRHMHEQNLALQHQIDTLRLQQAAIAEDAIEGQRLQSLLAFQQHYIGSTVAASVIGTSGSELSRVLYIDKGLADGLKPDMAVITPDGIVGKIRDVFPQAPHTAQVLLINDQTSGAGVVLARTRVRAVLRGTTAGYLQIGNLTPDDRIKPGEQVLTSGGDQVFPRGLPVGTIVSIAPDPEHQPYTAIRLKPAANLAQLEEVLVVTGTDASLPPATLKALAAGARQTADARTAAAQAAAERAAAEQAAKEEAARSAAEVVADRLPGLHDPNDPNAAAEDPAPAPGAPPGTPPGTKIDPKKIPVPRPLPTVHADRYSPGATPSASSLTPGAPHTEPSGEPTQTTPAPAPRRPTRPAAEPAPETQPGTPPDAATPPRK